MKQVATLVLLTPVLCGCIPLQKQTTAKCEEEGYRAFPGKDLRGSAPSRELAGYVRVSRKSTGYEYKCGGQISMSGNYGCYQPANSLARWIYYVEEWLTKFGFEI
jgi:hypothetical protein